MLLSQSTESSFVQEYPSGHPVPSDNLHEDRGEHTPVQSAARRQSGVFGLLVQIDPSGQPGWGPAVKPPHVATQMPRQSAPPFSGSQLSLGSSIHSIVLSEQAVPTKPPQGSGASVVVEVQEDPDDVVPSTHVHWYADATSFEPAAWSPGRLVQTPVSPHGQTSSHAPFTPFDNPITSYKRHKALTILRVLYARLSPEPLLRQTVSDCSQARGRKL